MSVEALAALEPEVPTPRSDVLGVRVSAITIEETVTTIQHWIGDCQRSYVCVTGVHGVMESQRDPELLRIHNEAGLVTPDGMPLVWLNKLNGFDWTERVYGPDLMLACCGELVEEGVRHFFYGGAEGVPELLAERLSDRFPGLEVAGTYSPPFRPLTAKEDVEIVDMINASDADIVWVGLSTPKQERWMAGHRAGLEASTLVGVGAAFDFHAGLKKQAPSWVQRSGLEWAFRLLSEPRRLAVRYLVNNPTFVWELFGRGRIRALHIEQPS